MPEVKEFIFFIIEYVKSRIVRLGRGFEGFKDVIVAFLVVKRGKYSNSFLNTSFFILVAATLVGGPIIAENNPFIGSFEQRIGNYQAAIVSYNPYESSLSTVISAKPRDKIIDYSVSSGDTLESISKKFGISIDTIKWANNLKSDMIKPGQIIKVPPITGVVHTVKSGDNIYTIAKKYKAEPQSIVNFPFNDFTDLDTFALAAGQIIYVPDGVIEEEQPRSAPSRFIAQIQAGVKGTSNFIWPTSGMITQNPVWYHMALDIANPSAPPVIASDTGTVTFASCIRYGYGCHVIIDHGNGYQTLYAHLSSYDVEVGQAVNQGQKIGNMGSTGKSTGTHLHFEVRSGGSLLNPWNFLK
ncbi:MAG: Peptidase M23 family protein [Candidatus Roizmanbacteria bacterium GW2011_GWA2_36_23]|uniref:Peptidase M23 family protein n=1 Tax=Candidatus Roizmanbacteria bacterium GW2011_GWA2_36_23 TaxID=1618480 RepID=A0A0G0E428_9BACT|nr:MAG: Peptidase M23 family protein [Candidatus Roizmanbacteria bacterium GW2011_GWA2_36_23]